jgi:hypothetical protein
MPASIRRFGAALGVCGLLVAGGVQPAAAQTFQPIPITTQLPDLTVSMTASPVQVGGGKELTYTISVRNIGVLAFQDPTTRAPVYFAATANGILLMHTLPAGLTPKLPIVANAGFTCVFVAPVVTCTGGSLQAAQMATITVKADAPLSPATLTSSVVVDPTNAIAERNESNNTTTAIATVPLPDLSVRLYSNSSQVDDGGPNSYLVYVDNPADSAAATGVSFRLTLPPGTRYGGASDGVRSWLSWIDQAGFTCSHNSGVVTCSGGHIGAGETGAATINVNAPRTNGPVTASVAVDPNNTIAERDEGNNSASVAYTVFGRPDLAVSTQFSPLTPPPLVQRVTRVQNLGVGAATNVEVRIDAITFDPPPGTSGADDSLSIVADSGFSCTRTGAPWPLGLYELGDRYRCTGGSIAAGGTATITIFHLMHWNSPERKTIADVDLANTIREADENNNHVNLLTSLW